MKRGKPLKRGKGLERKSGLKADAEKVREFLNRGRRELERSPMPRKRKQRPVEGPLSPAEWRVQVFEASGGECIITGSRARDADDPDFHAHHCLPKRELRARGLYGRVWDPRNGVLLRTDVHERHEHGARRVRVPHTALPASVWEFCRELDELAGTRWASDFVLREHPVRGERGHSQ
jgi:hypothetical protein